MGETFKIFEPKTRFQPSTKWRFGTWFERRRWETSIEFTTLYENILEYLLGTPMAEAYLNVQNLLYLDLVGLGTSYINYIATRIAVPCIYIKKRVWEIVDKFGSYN